MCDNFDVAFIIAQQFTHEFCNALILCHNTTPCNWEIKIFYRDRNRKQNGRTLLKQQAEKTRKESYVRGILKDKGYFCLIQIFIELISRQSNVD